MSYKIETVFDGEVFRPDAPVDLPPNTRATLTVEAGNGAALKNGTDLNRGAKEPEINLGDPYSVFKVALSLNLQGPPDFSENLDDYLYGDKRLEDE